MGRLITAEAVEIEFEKQNPDDACEWCIYVRVRKNNKEQNILTLLTNEKPYTRFTMHTGNLVKNSKESLEEVMSNVVELSKLEKEIIDNAIKTTKHKKNEN